VAYSIELVNLYRFLWEPCQDFKLAAKRFDDLPQRRNLHVGLLFQFRQAGLLDAEGSGHLLLTLARQLPDLAEQQLREQFLGAAGGPRSGLFRGRPFDELVE